MSMEEKEQIVSQPTLSVKEQHKKVDDFLNRLRPPFKCNITIDEEYEKSRNPNFTMGKFLTEEEAINECLKYFKE